MWANEVIGMNPNRPNDCYHNITTPEDFSAPAVQESLKGRIEAVFSERLNTLRAYDKRANTAMSDADYLVLKRRKDAVLNLMPEAHRRFAEAFPTLNVADELLQLNAPSTALTFDGLNREYAAELAAAIWILDELEDSGAIAEAAAYFPQSEDLLNRISLPNLSDSVHSDEALKAVICLLRSRNKGAEGFDGRITFGDAADTGYRKSEESEALPDRAAFDAVISLIDAQRAEAARTLFTDCVWELAQRLLSLIAGLRGSKGDVEAFYTFIQSLPASAGAQDNAQELYSGLKAPDIRSPYEMCFGFISLLDSGSDVVWLYNLSYDVLAYACQALPWADMGAVDPDAAQDVDVDYEYLSAAIEKAPDWDDNSMNEIMYKQLLHSPLCSPARRRISISQLAFFSSGLIPPRRGNSISYTKAILHDSELSQEQIALLYEYFSLAYAVNHKDAAYDEQDDDGTQEESAEDPKESAEEIKELRAEIKRLKNAVHQMKHRTKDTEAQLAEANRKLDAANEELAELRTMIREADSAEGSAPAAVTFPYTAQKRSVIIGGHDSWVKAIRPLLDNVRFISSSEQPNPGVIMNCEVVWLQTNALGHSGYYKVIDIVRRNHIKVCYFSYASAEKCAEQFALEDMQPAANADGAPDGENTAAENSVQ